MIINRRRSRLSVSFQIIIICIYAVPFIELSCYFVYSLGMKLLHSNLNSVKLDYSLSYNKFQTETFKNIMSKSPNALNLNAYVQGQGATNQMQQQGIDQTDPDMQSQTIEEQFDNFVKDIQNYNEIINQLAKNVDEANAQEYFITDFYPEYVLNCTYEDDEQKRIVATTDPQLARIMENLQRNNRVLKQQLKGWLFEFSKKTRLSQILISENQILRKRVCSKNKEIVKLIQTITRTENTDIVQLTQNLNQLKQQNGVLLDHLKKVKQSLKQNKDYHKQLVEAYEKTQKQKVEIQHKITEAEDEQEHNAKKVTLLESSVDQLSKREKRLQAQKERLSKILEDYRKDQAQIQKELQNCNIDREEIQNKLKNKFRGHQTEKQRLMDQIQDLSEQVQKVKQQTRNYESQIARNQRKIEQFTVMSQTLDKKIAQTQQQVESSKKQLNEVIKAQTQYLSDIDMINFDMQVLKQQINQLQRAEQQEQKNFKNQLQRVQQQKKQQIEKWTQQYHRVQRQSSTKVLQQKSELAFKRKQIEDWQHKVADKNNQLIDLKAQLKEIKENQSKVIELRKKLREAKLQ